MISSRFFRNIQLGIKTLLLHKMRSILTMLGMVFGVGAVIAMLAVGEGASKEAIDQISRLGSQNIIINSQEPIEQAASGSNRIRMNIYGCSTTTWQGSRAASRLWSAQSQRS